VPEYRDRCRLHDVHHCIDCGYHWYTVDDDGIATHVEGTGDGVS